MCLRCRPQGGHGAAHLPPMCNTEAFTALEQQFMATIVEHASEVPHGATAAAAAAAQQLQGTIETAARSADQGGKLLLKGHLVVMTYYCLFDQHSYSQALADIVPR